MVSMSVMVTTLPETKYIYEEFRCKSL